jgi:hypothetical protein
MAIARPSWLRLYGVALLMLAALVAVDVISAAGGLRTALEVTVALGGFGAMAGWARRNRAALDLQDWCECASAKTILRVIPSHRPFTATAPDPAAHHAVDTRTSRRKRATRAPLRHSGGDASSRRRST